MSPRPIAVACLMFATALATSAAAQTAAPATRPASAPAAASSPAPPPPAEPGSVIKAMQDEAAALQPMVHSELARSFLKSTACLPAIEPRTIHRDPATRLFLSPAQAAGLDDAARAALQEVMIDEARYYHTKYGSPMAYVRAVDVLGAHGVDSLDDKRILDIGYGTIGHLRLWANQGADVVGLDVDSFLTAMYSQPGDTGAIRSDCGPEGSIALVSGRLSDDETSQAVGAGYDVIISKNTLKRGYVAPPAEHRVDQRMLIDLGMDSDGFLRAMFERLKPGGKLLIYNLCPKQGDVAAGGTYSPMADGASPWNRAALEAAGFKVLAMDVDDAPAARQMGRALGWPAQGWDIETDLFAWYTVAERPAP